MIAEAPVITPPPAVFDDYLGLMSREFSRHRLIVFHGRSGSGKSTAIDHILDQHPDLRGRDCERLAPPDFRQTVDDTRLDLVVADDLTGLRQYLRLLPLLSRCRTLLIASHLPLQWHHATRPLVRTAIFRADRDTQKIRRYLQARKVGCSRAAVDTFVKHFGATYTDVDLILERFPGNDFDRSLSRFLKFCRLSLSS